MLYFKTVSRRYFYLIILPLLLNIQLLHTENTGKRNSSFVQQWVATEFTFTSKNYNTKYQKIISAVFEDKTVPVGWSAYRGGKIYISSTDKNSAGALCMDGRQNKWDLPAFNMYNLVKSNGSGIYKINFRLYADTLQNTDEYVRIIVRGTEADSNSFIKNQNGGYFATLPAIIALQKRTWVNCSVRIKVLESDLIRNSGTFNISVDSLNVVPGQHIYIDNFEIVKDLSPDIFNLVQMDAVFKGPDNTTMIMPAFWDGGNTWKVRFAPTLPGSWKYSTICNDTTDIGLNNQAGAFVCVPYTGQLEIYKHGFIKTEPATRYFMYSDGKPFFYMGDTHWSFIREPFDSSGVDGTPSVFKTIVDKRVSQGFTVYQSEPLGIANVPYVYNLKDGVTEEDITGFKDLDRRFKYIADKGMVHANSQLVFVDELADKVYTKDYVRNLCRMWVARYSAYPVLWTTAQECDPDFYTERNISPFTVETNPWKYVLTEINNIDPYKHPGTAHQEYAHIAPGAGACASRSSFRNIPGHNWYAVQWTPQNNAQIDFKIPKDFWINGQGKPIILYEPSYDHLWAMEFGARQQCWCGFLNGMQGVAYGAEDIWFHNSGYDMNTGHVNGYDTITVADKQIKWFNSVNLPAATEVASYMHNFFDSFEWWKLVPCFDDPEAKHIKITNGLYSAAAIDNKIYVIYLYNKGASNSGNSLMGLAAGNTYTAKWFNPRTGVYLNIEDNVKGTGSNSAWQIPPKPDENDWVLFVRINNREDR
jgi:hypothetical protein